MNMTRIIPALFAAAALFVVPTTASAQWAPSPTVIIVNPSPAYGGGWGPGVATTAWGGGCGWGGCGGGWSNAGWGGCGGGCGGGWSNVGWGGCGGGCGGGWGGGWNGWGGGACIWTGWGWRC
jgi:uncharacterized low-complexity protein